MYKSGLVKSQLFIIFIVPLLDFIMIWINIDRTKNISLTKQIFEQIRSKILKKELTPGEKLPSTRKLSLEFKVSRNLILEVYDQLLAEGYLDTHKGSGTYIAKGTFLEKYIDSYSYDVNDYFNKKIKNWRFSPVYIGCYYSKRKSPFVTCYKGAGVFINYIFYDTTGAILFSSMEMCSAHSLNLTKQLCRRHAEFTSPVSPQWDTPRGFPYGTGISASF